MSVNVHADKISESLLSVRIRLSRTASRIRHFSFNSHVARFAPLDPKLCSTRLVALHDDARHARPRPPRIRGQGPDQPIRRPRRVRQVRFLLETRSKRPKTPRT